MENKQNRSEEVMKKFERALPSIWKRAKVETECLLKMEKYKTTLSSHLEK